MDQNLRVKTYDADKIYVINHEKDSIYNDITKFDKDKMAEVMDEYKKYPEGDTTVLLRGSDS